MTVNEPFLPCSFVTSSPSGLERVYTTISPTRILLTANSRNVVFKRQQEILVGVDVDEFPKIRVGMPLITLGISVKGIITALVPMPSVDSNFRMVINYHPLSKSNMQKSAAPH